MKISKVTQKNGAWYTASLKPERVALNLYMLILSLLVSNLLWMKVLYLCSPIEVIDLKELVTGIMSVHFVYALATTFVWKQMLQECGKSVITLVTFFVWHGSKTFAVCLEICSIRKFYRRFVYYTPKEQYKELTNMMALGLFVIGVVEVFGLVLALKYIQLKKPFETTKTRVAYSATVSAV